MSPMIHREDNGAIAVLRLDHGKVSALDLELLEELEAVLAEVEGSDRAALVLTGTGSTFSAGVDLFRVLDGGEAYVARFVPALSRALAALFTFPRPTVAAINGHAIAGGCILACACDVKVMATGRGRIGVPELRVGVPFPAAALEVLRFAVPRQHLPAMTYTGRTFLPEEALDHGLVDELAAPEQLRDRALAAARGLTTIPPETFGLTKRQLRGPALERMKAQGEEVDAKVEAIWSAPEIHRVIRDYLDRTIGKKG